jgi:transcription-repair coupling factor (superfamily II helicase)
LQRSLKEASGELAARLAAGSDRRFPVMGLRGAAGVLMLREVARGLDRPLLVVTARASEAEALAREAAFFMDEPEDGDATARRIHLYPAWELQPLAQLSPPADVQAAQIAALYALARTPAPIVVTSTQALMQRTLARAVLAGSIVRIATAERVDLDLLVDALVSAGYQRVPQTEEPGDFSVRGGIIDAFSPLYRDPIRFELEDDLVTSIRRFDADSQRSAGAMDEAIIVRTRFIAPAALKEKKLRDAVAVRAADLGIGHKQADELAAQLESGLLFPGVELLTAYLHGGLESVFDHLPDAAIAWLVDPGRILAEASRFGESVTAEAAAAAARPSFHPEPHALYLAPDEFERALGRLVAVETGSLITVAQPREGVAPPIEVTSQPALRITSAELSGGRNAPSFEPLAVQLRAVQRAQGRALMIVEGPNQAARLRRHLEAYDLEVNTECATFTALLEWPDYRPAIMQGEVGTGVVLPADGIYVYSEEELFGEPRVRRRARRSARGAILNLEELKPSDLVVHLDHGIGRYRGLRHMKVADVEGDFLNLEYAGDDTMYVPVERINLVQRYVGGGDGGAPKLDRLGSGSWEKVKRRTREAVMAMAAELLEIYAAREVLEGHAFPHPGADYHEFCDRFEFEETPDQDAAIDDVIRDLTRSKPMDRLICGDAGFGKTEVALRAAFIAVMDARQVAVLVPTTVLAEQHWETIRRRFAGYPVRVEMVSRFRSAKDNRAVIEDLARGKVDIVVGTHRLLSSDVSFPRLGLLIIDEEHRFGVADKEKLKRLKKLVHVLTMTATPIPRTLNMALVGIRDLSVIQTPPPDRQAIRTLIGRELDDATIRDAILRELNRGGQVFFVHNQVKSIGRMAQHLREIIPEAKIAIAHGQMAGHELENVMRDFIENRINLLVCSTIIESGLDIPNANTMIVNRADHMGLAQLYQLRGRIGRSRQRAYAYLLIPGEHIITRDAKRRLDALRELVEADTGIGFKLAMADLEQRGAGNLLGREQSGEIAAVGFELYTEMMEQAIAELRGQPRRPDFEPELRLGIPAYIPDSYAPDENERLVLYRRMARAESEEELNDIRGEMRDRFGPIPTLIENLVRAMNLRRCMKELMIVSAILKAREIEVRFHPDAPVDIERLTALANANRRTMKLTPSYQVMARIEPGDYDSLFAQLDGVLQALGGCEKLEHQPARGCGPAPN